MTELENEKLQQEGWLGSCLLWFFWGVSLSFLTILSLVLMVLLAASVALNIYLGWEMAGLEVSISRQGPATGDMPAPVPSVLAAIPTNTPVLPPTGTPTPVPGESPLESQYATLAAIATQAASARYSGTPVAELPPPTATATPVPPAAVPTAVAIGTPASDSGPANTAPEAAEAESAAAAVTGEEAQQAFVPPPATSSNTYTLIPLEQPRDGRPPEEHGDLNLKLRKPQPSSVEPALVDIDGSGIDPNSFKFSSVFEPNFVATYAVHDWDWNCNCPGDLLPEDKSVLVGIKTTPGEPIFIPKKDQDIYQGKYYAVVLYASEDSLTFLYGRAGTVASGYTIHYLGLHTDPNLLALFRESTDNELPGLTLDTPVGVAASDELIVAVRDNGTFMDARSRLDWWD